MEIPVARESVWAIRGAAALRMARQEIRDALLAWGPYLTVAGGMLIAVLLIYNSLRFVTGSGLEILARPFANPVLAVTMLALLYVTVTAALAIARPREQGTLQILFFAPVDAWALVGSHFLGGVALYTLMILFLIPLLGLLSLLTNIFLPPALVVGMIISIPIAASAVALGLALSALAPSSRSAVLLLVSLLALVAAVQGGYSALLQIPPSGRYYDALLFLRMLLRTVNDLLGWISPTNLLSHVLDAALRHDYRSILRAGALAVGGTAFWLVIAIRMVGRRGVLP